MRVVLWLAGLWAFSLVALAGEPLAPFTTDGCSLFPDGTWPHPLHWQDCCVRHDLAYWMGGTVDQREQADQALRRCVVNQGYPGIGELMLNGVRLGGSPFFPTSYRWGYGWPYPRGYKPLSEPERDLVLEHMQRRPSLLDETERLLSIRAAPGNADTHPQPEQIGERL